MKRTWRCGKPVESRIKSIVSTQMLLLKLILDPKKMPECSRNKKPNQNVTNGTLSKKVFVTIY